MISYRNFAVGDLVKVFFRIWEADKERVVPFEGVVISIRGEGESKTVTIRKTTRSGVAVERIFPLSSPNLIEVAVKKKGRVRRAKLYYLRKGSNKKKS